MLPRVFQEYGGSALAAGQVAIAAGFHLAAVDTPVTAFPTEREHQSKARARLRGIEDVHSRAGLRQSEYARTSRRLSHRAQAASTDSWGWRRSQPSRRRRRSVRFPCRRITAPAQLPDRLQTIHRQTAPFAPPEPDADRGDGVTSLNGADVPQEKW